MDVDNGKANTARKIQEEHRNVEKVVVDNTQKQSDGNLDINDNAKGGAYTQQEYLDMVACYVVCNHSLPGARTMFQEWHGRSPSLEVIEEAVQRFDKSDEGLIEPFEKLEAPQTTDQIDTNLYSNDLDTEILTNSNQEQHYYKNNFSRIPIVYTTRLEEMKCLKQNKVLLPKQDIINAILFESKPKMNCSAFAKKPNENLSTKNPQNHELTDKLESINKTLTSSATRCDKGGISVKHRNKNMKRSFPAPKTVPSKSKLLRKIQSCKNAKFDSNIDINNSETSSSESENNNILITSVKQKPASKRGEDINKTKPRRGDSDVNSKTILIISSSESEDDILPLSSIKKKQASKIEEDIHNEPVPRRYIIFNDLFTDEYEVFTFYDSNITQRIFRTYESLASSIDASNLRTMDVCCWFRRVNLIRSLPGYDFGSEVKNFLIGKHKCSLKKCTCCCRTGANHIENDLLFSAAAVTNGNTTPPIKLLSQNKISATHYNTTPSTKLLSQNKISAPHYNTTPPTTLLSQNKISAIYVNTPPPPKLLSPNNISKANELLPSKIKTYLECYRSENNINNSYSNLNNQCGKKELEETDWLQDLLTKTTARETVIDRALHYSRTLKIRRKNDTSNKTKPIESCLTYAFNNSTSTWELFGLDQGGKTLFVTKEMTCDAVEPTEINKKVYKTVQQLIPPQEVVKFEPTCCWFKGETSVNFLTNVHQHIGNFIRSPHRCPDPKTYFNRFSSCKCCCAKPISIATQNKDLKIIKDLKITEFCHTRDFTETKRKAIARKPSEHIEPRSYILNKVPKMIELRPPSNVTNSSELDVVNRILDNFKNIRLIIKEDKVAIDLDSPLDRLTVTELKVLSKIIIQAQNDSDVSLQEIKKTNISNEIKRGHLKNLATQIVNTAYCGKPNLSFAIPSTSHKPSNVIENIPELIYKMNESLLTTMSTISKVNDSVTSLPKIGHVYSASPTISKENDSVISYPKIGQVFSLSNANSKSKDSTKCNIESEGTTHTLPALIWTTPNVTKRKANDLISVPPVKKININELIENTIEKNIYLKPRVESEVRTQKGKVLFIKQSNTSNVQSAASGNYVQIVDNSDNVKNK